MTLTRVKTVYNEPTTGTVIRATHRPQDLIPAFQATYDHLCGRTLSREWPDDNSPYWESEEAAELLDDLFIDLDNLAPRGMYFGTHPGDGSNFGFWGIEGDDADD